MKKKIVIHFINKKDKTFKEVEIRPQKTMFVVVDKNGIRRNIYVQEKIKHVKKLRVNNPNVGIIFNNIFHAFSDFDKFFYNIDYFLKLIAKSDFKDQQEKYNNVLSELKLIEAANETTKP